MFFKSRKNNPVSSDKDNSLIDVKNIKVAQYVDVKELISSEINEVKEQVFNYGEICEVLNTKTMNPEAYIDKLYILMQSFNFSVVSLSIVDEDGKLDIYSRGYKDSLDEELLAQWQDAVEVENNSIDWAKLLDTTQQEDGKVNELLVTENLGRIGFSPIEERGTIFGFIFIGVKVGDEPSVFASSCLETLGSRIGILLRHNLEAKECRDSFLNYRNDCHDSLRILNKKLELLNDNFLKDDLEARKVLSECQTISNTILKM